MGCAWVRRRHHVQQKEEQMAHSAVHACVSTRRGQLFGLVVRMRAGLQTVSCDLGGRVHGGVTCSPHDLVPTQLGAKVRAGCVCVRWVG